MPVDRAEFLAVMSALLGNAALEAPDDVALALLGADDASVSNLWIAARKKFDERTIGTIDVDVELSAAITASDAGPAMAPLLSDEDDVDAR